MNIDAATILLPALREHPTASSWRGLELLLDDVDDGDRPRVVELAEAAIEGWPAAIRDGTGWYRRPRLDGDPRWRLARALTCEGPLRPLPDAKLTTLRLRGADAASVQSLERWEGRRELEVVELDEWRQYEPGLAARLLGALDPGRVRELHLEKQKPASDELVRALAGAEWPALRALTFTSCRDDQVDALVAAPCARTLEALRLSQGPMSPDGIARLVAGLGTPLLRSLGFVREVDRVLAEVIGASAPALVSLRAPFGAGALAAFTASAVTSALEVLDLEWGSGTDAADARALGAWPGAASLRALSLVRGDAFDDAAFAALAASDRLAGLAAVRLDQCRFGDPGARAWAARAHPGLQRLELRMDAGLGDDGISALAASPALADLRVLDLAESRLGDRGAAALAGSPHLGALRELVLSRTGVGPAGLAALLASPNVRSLDTLRLDSPEPAARRIGAAGAWAISGAEGLSGLRRLSLAGQDIPRHVLVEALCASPHLRGLVELDVSGNPGFGSGGGVLAALRTAGFSHLLEVIAAEGP